MQDKRSERPLSRREREIAEAYAGGASYREIADRLCIAPATVRTHVGTIYRKLGVSSKVALLRAIEDAGSPGGEGPLEADRPGFPRVHVASFRGAGRRGEALSVELMADISTRLAQVAGLTVTTDPRSARYLVEGDVCLAGSTVRVYARLIDAGQGTTLWADRVETTAGEPLEVVDHCSARVAGGLRWGVASAHATRISDCDLDALSLHDLLVLAGVRSGVPTKASWIEGGRIAERALRRAPDDAMALSMAATGLGLAEALLGFGHTEPGVFDLALRRAEAALRQDNRSAFAHVVRGWLLLVARRRHDEATAIARHALRVNPDYAPAHGLLGATLVFAGDWGAGTASAERAAAIDERDPYLHLYARIAGLGHLGEASPGRAAKWFQRCEHLAPGLPQNLAGLAVARVSMGHHEAAARAASAFRQSAPDLGLADLRPLPFRDPADWSRFTAALRLAGLPA